MVAVAMTRGTAPNDEDHDAAQRGRDQQADAPLAKAIHPDRDLRLTIGGSGLALLRAPPRTGR